MRNTAKIILKPGKEAAVKRFHPWIFSGAIEKIEGAPREGDIIEVKLIAVDDQGRIKLSRKAVLMEAKGLEYKMEPQAPRRDRGPRR